MKTLDLSACTGGNQFAETAGTLNFLQSAYTEIVAQTLIAQIGTGYSVSTPYILYGCVATVGGSTTTITAGAIFYNGEVFIVPAPAPITNPTGGNVLLCTLSVANNFAEPDGTPCDPATFTTGSALSVHNIRTISYVTGPSGGSGVTNYKFDFSAAIPYLVGQNNTGWGSLSVATGSGNGTISGTIQYKLNPLTKTLQLHGDLNVGTPGDFTAIPNTIYKVIGNLPAGYFPRYDNCIFIGNVYLFPTNMPILDSTSAFLIDHINYFVDNLGTIYGLFYPSASSEMYQSHFNVIIPLN